MKQSRRQALPRDEPPETENEIGTSRAFVGYAYGVARRPILAAAALFTLLLLLMVLSAFRRSSPFDVLLSGYPSPEKTTNATCSSVPKEARLTDKFHGGFLSTALNESSCLSRYQSSLYRKPSNHTPSAYLDQKLRRYEALHKKCGPGTELFRQSVKHLASNRTTGPLECNYVVWLPADGLGNRMISIVSAFLYALLNDKVLLLHLPRDMADLFCEPFPDTSWLLPRDDFPVKNLDRIFEHDPHSYGKLLRNKVLSNDMNVSSSSSSLPGYLYLHLLHANDDFDKMFYCGEGQQLLKNFPWLLLRSNEYFAPAFFFIPEIQEELDLLFPEKSTVFHHLGRYLYNPTNSVWGYITRYHEAYLANARDVLGIQIRIFAFAKVEFDDMLSQIVNCSVKENLLPEVDLEGSNSLPGITDSKPKAVLVASLMGEYFDKLRDRYYEHAAVTGEVVGVYQPSHEEQQRTDKLTHNMKALAEIFLLSMSDEVITSPFSTFGYVAHGLGGLRPLILVRNRNQEPPCVRSLSMEPCFHFPPSYDCIAKKKVDKGSMMPYIKHCEDFFLGVKVFDN
ncbi:fucosyltransferase 2-like [Zingiber officinale]|uniref:Fucosyltransferase n=1 Tax=Zingiber officinale TaxID=94328 RepID=A0A8J5GQV2_ZINOF|nr:fucosyltransferase 2-like [Zingiber officinale]KAG6508200.1 hypothetical protein ZIOFF_033572 [Zingiber officinale]